MALTTTMKQAIEYIQFNGEKIFRYPGGYWAKEKWIRLDGHFGTPTIEALVSRKVLQYTEWQEGRNGKFPVAAELIGDYRACRCRSYHERTGQHADVCPLFKSV